MINLRPSQLQKDETIEFTFSRIRIRGRVVSEGRVAMVSTDGAALGHKEFQLFDEFTDVYRIKIVEVAAKRVPVVVAAVEAPAEPSKLAVIAAGDTAEYKVQDCKASGTN